MRLIEGLDVFLGVSEKSASSDSLDAWGSCMEATNRE